MVGIAYEKKYGIPEEIPDAMLDNLQAWKDCSQGCSMPEWSFSKANTVCIQASLSKMYKTCNSPKMLVNFLLIMGKTTNDGRKAAYICYHGYEINASAWYKKLVSQPRLVRIIELCGK